MTNEPIYLIATSYNKTTGNTEKFVWDGEGAIPIPTNSPSVRNHLLNHATSYTSKIEIRRVMRLIDEEKKKGHIYQELVFNPIKVSEGYSIFMARIKPIENYIIKEGQVCVRCAEKSAENPDYEIGKPE